MNNKIIINIAINVESILMLIHKLKIYNFFIYNEQINYQDQLVIF